MDIIFIKSFIMLPGAMGEWGRRDQMRFGSRHTKGHARDELKIIHMQQTYN